METAKTLSAYVKEIIGFLVAQVSIEEIVLVIGAIIAAIAIPLFLWKFGRKGFAAIKNALQGKNAGI